MRRFKAIPNGRFLDLDSGKSICFNSFLSVDYAVVYYTYEDSYYKKGLLHREDGPACIAYDDDKKTIKLSASYYLDGTGYDLDDWFQKISKENRIKYLFELHLYKS